MRLRKIPEAADVVNNSPYVVHDPFALKGAWKTDERRPLMLEIGMGKGRFLIDMALKYPDRDLVGIELYDSVLFRACLRMEGVPYSTPRDQIEIAKENIDVTSLPVPDNLRFINVDARDIGDIFAPGEVDRIYLNFSDPWPKARHAKRRLTSREFLARYENVLKTGGSLEFKTDNRDLFDFSIDEINEAEKWELVSVTYDLHKDAELMKENVMTEYERKFSALGNHILRLEAVLKS